MDYYCRVRVKMCGMTNANDIKQAIQLGADAIGIILYPKSKRFISAKQARSLLPPLPPFINLVAVMVNPSEMEVDEVIQTLPVNYLQFHGDEPPKFCEQFNFPYIKSISARTRETILAGIKNYTLASAILLDTPSINEYGGSGNPFDWSIIPKIREKLIILAGGLNSTNVAKAIAQANPYAVDVCSGIEKATGIKSEEKMSQFLNAVKN